MLDDLQPVGGSETQTAFVVSLGKSRGTSTVAAGLALVAAVEVRHDVLFAELDPSGGELLEKLYFRGRPTTATEGSAPPPGSRELADRLSGLDLEFDPDSAAAQFEQIEVRSRFTVKADGIDGLSVIMGDPLVGVAAPAASAITPRLKQLASASHFDVAVIDGGRWNSAQPERLTGVDVVYAVVEANSTSQLHRCVAEMQALWYELHRINPAGRMVVVLTNLEWDTAEVVDLFLSPPGTPPTETSPPYRVVPLEITTRRQSRAFALISQGKWKSAAQVKRGLEPFHPMASVIGLGRDHQTPVGPLKQGTTGEGEPPIDEFPYLSTEPDEGPDHDAADLVEVPVAPPVAEAHNDQDTSGRWPFPDFGAVEKPRNSRRDSQAEASPAKTDPGGSDLDQPQPSPTPPTPSAPAKPPARPCRPAGESWPPPRVDVEAAATQTTTVDADAAPNPDPDPDADADAPGDGELSRAVKAALANKLFNTPTRFRK